jgi:hypothetical protein
MKVIDWEADHVLRFPRANGGAEARTPLVEGWIARSWVSSPLLRRNRSNRQSALVDGAVHLLAGRPREAASEEVFRTCIAEALAPIDALGAVLVPQTHRWCRERLWSLTQNRVAMVEEHSDFVLANLVVETPTTALREIDKPSDKRVAIVGADAVSLSTDLLCLSLGLKHQNVDVALTAMLKSPPGVARDIYRLLWADFGADTSVVEASSLTLVAILRYTTNNGPVPGLASFLDRCAAGELDRALRRLSSSAAHVV